MVRCCWQWFLTLVSTCISLGTTVKEQFPSPSGPPVSLTLASPHLHVVPIISPRHLLQDGLLRGRTLVPFELTIMSLPPGHTVGCFCALVPYNVFRLCMWSMIWKYDMNTSLFTSWTFYKIREHKNDTNFRWKLHIKIEFTSIFVSSEYWPVVILKETPNWRNQKCNFLGQGTGGSRDKLWSGTMYSPMSHHIVSLIPISNVSLMVYKSRSRHCGWSIRRPSRLSSFTQKFRSVFQWHRSCQSSTTRLQTPATRVRKDWKRLSQWKVVFQNKFLTFTCFFLSVVTHGSITWLSDTHLTLSLKHLGRSPCW